MINKVTEYIPITEEKASDFFKKVLKNNMGLKLRERVDFPAWEINIGIICFLLYRESEEHLRLDILADHPKYPIGIGQSYFDYETCDLDPTFTVSMKVDEEGRISSIELLRFVKAYINDDLEPEEAIEIFLQED